MKDVIDQVWFYVGIVSVLVAYLARLIAKVLGVFEAVKNQERIKQTLRAQGLDIGRLETETALLKRHIETQDKEIENIRHDNDKQWESIKGLENRTFDMLGKNHD